MTRLTIPDSVTSIDKEAFRDCSGITNMTIGAGVRDIGAYAFYKCIGLTNVTIPDSVTSIKREAFFGCTGLMNVTILGNVTNDWEESNVTGKYIDNPFKGCTNLETAVLGGKMAKIGNNMFNNCTGLRNVAIGSGMTSIGDWAFCNCNISDVAIPDSVTNIGKFAFSACNGFGNVTIPDNVTGIGEGAFQNCIGLTNVTIGMAMTCIEDGMFYNCTGLESMTIPVNVTNVGNSVFSGSGLKVLYVPAAWEGTTLLDEAGMPEDCTVVYGVLPEEKTTTSGVPYSWLKEKAASILSANGGDYEAAARAQAANGINTVWECYVAGLDPTNEYSKFTAEIFLMDGKPVVASEPDLGEERAYTVEGVEDLDDAWGETNAATRFFRVKVALPE
jgi:hypothetical protein